MCCSFIRIAKVFYITNIGNEQYNAMFMVYILAYVISFDLEGVEIK